MFKEQLSRLSASLIRIAFFREDRASQMDTKIITACELWLHKDERQRVLWPSTIALSLDYYESLQVHAVPLCESDLAAFVNRHGNGTPDRRAKGTPLERRFGLVQVANRRDPRVTRSALTSDGAARAGGGLFAHLGKLGGDAVSRGS